MSDDFFGDEYGDFDGEGEQQQSGGGLRQFAERVKQENEALRKRLEDLESAKKQEKLTDALKGAGVANPGALGKWAEKIDPEEASDFLTAVKAAMGLEAAPQGVSPDEAAAVAAMSGEPAGAAPVTTNDAVAAIGGIDNEADFWKAVRSQ